MKNKIVLMVLLLIIFSINSFADNPIVQTIYTADPAPMVYNDTCYVYTTHDEDVVINDFFTMNDWRCYSSTDMVNWTDHGSPLHYTAFSWASGDAWAAQCVYRNNKFYFYVTVTRSGGSRTIGVAVSDNPTGPFTDALGVPLIDLFGWDDIDPTVFIDDDGQAYLYWGNPNLYYVKLNADMISYSGSAVQVYPKPTDYQEGPWLYKRNGLYYMVYPTTCCAESIAHATSNSPTGPWTYRNVIMPAQGGSFTNHPGVCDFAGNSYFFYHNGALPDGGGYHRSVCIEEFSYNADGTIPAFNMTTAGVSQVSYLNPYDTNQAETICWESGIETETCSEGGMNIGFIENGDWIKVKGVDFGTGATSFEARVASSNSGGNIEIRLDSVTGTIVGTCAVPGTGGWQDWVTETCTVNGASGLHDLYFVFTGGSGTLFNVNWWKFYGGQVTTPTPTPGPTPTPNEEPIWSGGPYTLNGTTDYIDLPDGLTSDLNDFSIACWVNLNSLDNWSRIFDFGIDTNVFMMLSPASGNTGYPYFSITISGNDGEQGINGTSALPTGSWQHMAVVKSGSTGILYINTQEAGRNTNITLNPADLGNTTNNYIGRSQWSQDPYLNASIDEFVVYNRAISAAEVAALGSTPPDDEDLLGDANGNGSVDIVDALLIAQYYVGLNPSEFIPGNADVNCDESIDIVDALLIAQYYVGLIQSFC